MWFQKAIYPLQSLRSFHLPEEKGLYIVIDGENECVRRCTAFVLHEYLVFIVTYLFYVLLRHLE